MKSCDLWSLLLRCWKQQFRFRNCTFQGYKITGLRNYNNHITLIFVYFIKRTLCIWPSTPNLYWPRSCSAISVLFLGCIDSFFLFQSVFALPLYPWIAVCASNRSRSLFTSLETFCTFKLGEKVIHFLSGLCVDLLLQGKKHKKVILNHPPP